MKKNGFTLVELLVYMTIFSVFIVLLTNTFVTILDAKLESESISSVEQDGNTILNRLTYDISHASAITTPASLGQQTNMLLVTVNGIDYTYSLSGNNLIITSGGQSNQLNGYNTAISNLSFQRIGNVGHNPTVKLSFTITGNILKHSGNDVINFSTTISTR